MVQLSGVYNDSKTFVDMPMRYTPELVLAKFNFMSSMPGNISTTELQVFLDHNFYEAGSDILHWIPTDYNSNPDFIFQITNVTYQSWAKDLNDLWLTLGREHAESVSEFPERQSYLPRKHPFIVPGGRFRETYYWDSLW
jgi:alpha,alpha-trehalase